MAEKQVRSTKRKQFKLDCRVVDALETLARDRGSDLEYLAEEAFRDLLKKHRRPITFHDALRHSIRAVPANDRAPKRARSRS